MDLRSWGVVDKSKKSLDTKIQQRFEYCTNTVQALMWTRIWQSSARVVFYAQLVVCRALSPLSLSFIYGRFCLRTLMTTLSVTPVTHSLHKQRLLYDVTPKTEENSKCYQQEITSFNFSGNIPTPENYRLGTIRMNFFFVIRKNIICL